MVSTARIKATPSLVWMCKTSMRRFSRINPFRGSSGLVAVQRAGSLFCLIQIDQVVGISEEGITFTPALVWSRACAACNAKMAIPHDAWS